MFKEAERQAQTRLVMLKKNLSSFLAENIKPVKAMAGMVGLRLALTGKEQAAVARANAVLDHFQSTLDAEVCYLMNRRGDTVASFEPAGPR